MRTVQIDDTLSMKTHSLLKTNRLLFGLGIVLTIAFAYAVFFSDQSFFGKKHSGEVIGTIQPIGSDVRQKHASSTGYFTEVKVENATEAFNQDSIFAGKNSGAKINLQDGSTLELTANSMIILEKPTDQSGLFKVNIIQGSAKVNTSAQTSKAGFQVSKNGKNFKLKKDSVAQFYGDQKDLHVKLFTPASEVADDHEQVVTVSTTDTITLFKNVEPPAVQAEASKSVTEEVVEQRIPASEEITAEPVYSEPVVEAEPIEAKAPVITKIHLEKSEYKFLLSKRKQIDYNFSPYELVKTPTFQIAEELDTAVEYEISQYSDFKEDVHTLEATKLPARWKSPSGGLFFIRAKLKDIENAEWSSPARIHIVYDRPHLNFDNKHKNLSISSGYAGEKFEYTISRTSDFKVTEQNEITNSTTLSLKEKAPGKYFAKARMLNAKNWPISMTSKTITFEIPEIVQKSLPLRKVASVEPESEKVKLPAIIETKLESPKKEYLAKKYSFTLGAGFNSLTYAQVGHGSVDSSNYQTISPAGMIGASYSFTSNTSVVGEYHYIPGTIKSQGDTALSSNSYTWSTSLIEVDRKMTEQSDQHSWSLLGGIQRNQFPFMYQNQDGIVTLATTTQLNASVGARADFYQNDPWSYEVYLRYQQPLSSQSSSGTLSVTPKYSLDSSVGVARRLQSGNQIGLYWIGQSNQFNYNHSAPDAAADSTGTQTMFNSNFQLRFNWNNMGLFLMTIPMLPRRRKKHTKHSRP